MLTSSSPSGFTGGSSTTNANWNPSPWLEALASTLAQLDDLLARLSDTQYVCAALPGFASGIGPHVRHCLDHVAALAAGLAGDDIDYESRERGTTVETDCRTARLTLQALQARLLEAPGFDPDRPVQVAIRLRHAEAPALIGSTLGRELAFVQSHTIHHQAMIAALAVALGVRPPDGFGFAPATLAYQAQSSCAPSH